MFVNNNSGKAIHQYFFEKLKDVYEENEINQFFEWLIWGRHGLEKYQKNEFLNGHWSESDLLYWREAVKRLLNHTPIQHVVGKTEFFGLEIEVNSNTLIPRPETEELVELIAYKLKSNSDMVGWDIGTGSGCIPLALAKDWPSLSMVGTDISKSALKIAEKNRLKHQIDRVSFVQHDILNDALPFAQKVDFVVSNPPYVLENEKAEMQKSVLNHEPSLALFVSDDNPLLFYKRIADVGIDAIKPGGHLFFEIHEDFADEVLQMLHEKGYSNCEIHEDLQGKSRIINGEIS